MGRDYARECRGGEEVGVGWTISERGRGLWDGKSGRSFLPVPRPENGGAAGEMRQAIGSGVLALPERG